MSQPILDRLRVILVSSRNPLNIGAAARAMSNFGFSRLRVVNPYQAAFREARSAVGASSILAEAEEPATVAEAVADCSLVIGTTAVRHRQLQQPLHGLQTASARIRKRLGSGNVALLFGSERVGLSNDDLSHCHWLLRIPTRDENISMNLGQAVAVCLYELIREAKVARAVEKNQPALAQEVERLTSLLNESLQLSGYPGPATGNERKIRRLIRRANLSDQDAEVWLGIFRQIGWKLRHPESGPKAVR